MDTLPFVIQFVPLPPTFRGKPSEFAQEIVSRMSIAAAPGSVGFIYPGTDEPGSNVGLWLKGGQLWVWDNETSKYIPQDISHAYSPKIDYGDTEPTNPLTPLWVKTVDGRAVGLFSVEGDTPATVGCIPASGPTSGRPTNPVDLERYWDTDCGTLIHWERAMWRTVAGTPGDVKWVTHLTLAEAERRNPGWQVLGSADSKLRGRSLVSATKDPGETPIGVVPPDSGTPERIAGTLYGGDKFAVLAGGAAQTQGAVALWALQKT